MTEKKPRTPRIPYEIVDEEALAKRFPELVKMVRKFDEPALYKKVKAALEVGLEIPGVRIGTAAVPAGAAELPPIAQDSPHLAEQSSNPLSDLPNYLQSDPQDGLPL